LTRVNRTRILIIAEKHFLATTRYIAIAREIEAANDRAAETIVSHSALVVDTGD